MLLDVVLDVGTYIRKVSESSGKGVKLATLPIHLDSTATVQLQLSVSQPQLTCM